MAETAPAPMTSSPAQPVPVAMLGRTSTLALQDPAASIRRQIRSAQEWLPAGWYIAGFYWDVESGALDIEERGHSTWYEQFTSQGIPRDGGLADLLTESKAPAPRFTAVVCEDIERSARDFYNSVKLERQLSDQGIPIFAADEPADITGISPTTILVRRIKQGSAEYFRFQLKQKTWDGMREHAMEGWNTGPRPLRVRGRQGDPPQPGQSRPGPHKKPA